MKNRYSVWKLLTSLCLSPVILCSSQADDCIESIVQHVRISNTVYIFEAVPSDFLCEAAHAEAIAKHETLKIGQYIFYLQIIFPVKEDVDRIRNILSQSYIYREDPYADSCGQIDGAGLHHLMFSSFYPDFIVVFENNDEIVNIAISGGSGEVQVTGTICRLNTSCPYSDRTDLYRILRNYSTPERIHTSECEAEN